MTMSPWAGHHGQPALATATAAENRNQLLDKLNKKCRTTIKNQEPAAENGKAFLQSL
jgi:hypothetical protein